MKRNKTPGQILRKAATLLKNYGWTRGLYVDSKGRFCALGAMARADGIDLDNVYLASGSRAYKQAKVKLEDLVDDDVVEWNDRQKSKRTVIAALRRAALT